VCFSFAAFCRLVSHPKYTWPPFDLYYICNQNCFIYIFLSYVYWYW
jgi:hypothetical protein